MYERDYGRPILKPLLMRFALAQNVKDWPGVLAKRFDWIRGHRYTGTELRVWRENHKNIFMSIFFIMW